MAGSHAFVRALGPGINIMASVLRYDQLEAADWHGLARRVGHVRLGGWLVEPLMDWSACPARTRTGIPDDVARDMILNGSGADPDPRAALAFARFKRAAENALVAGLRVVLNPFHKRFLVEVNEETVRWVWAAVLHEFDARRFPTDKVAFEMVNEPAMLPGHARVGGDFVAMARTWVRQVRAAQPDRVILLTGVQGKRGGGPSLSSGEGLLAELRGGLIKPFDHMYSPAFDLHPAVITFHYYEPHTFITQSIHAHVRWGGLLGSMSAQRAIYTHFAAINASSSQLPVYLGEFGVPIDGRVEEADGVAWLATVRRAAEAFGFGYALWTYVSSIQGVTAGDTACARLGKWDNSSFVAAALGLAAQPTRYQVQATACELQSSSPPSPPSPPTTSPAPLDICKEDAHIRPPYAHDLFSLLTAPTPPVGPPLPQTPPEPPHTARLARWRSTGARHWFR